MASTFTNLLYHIVYSTKYRKETIEPAWQENLYEYMGGIIRERDGILLQIGGMPDHVHILAKLSPKYAIMDVLREIKAGSSKWVNERSDLSGRFEWQAGYGAFSVSQSYSERVALYIRNQVQHHMTKTFRSEFIQLLKRHRIEFDLKYVFEEEHIA
ncbi:MAG: family transposase [Planctomycetaceae bacterium]|nr:family transposase [Planctomycetaceae bacterium]